ncbi:FAD-binding oxidoreductase [Phytoactinopolyspora alkaliphila]|uniref:FAD-binding oxidoreductase n=1 Tax=Phytoactinopolyspora alkaliphila TaxID=1783498 RepID=A0A6N9YG47_9ACTN|nr:FAD-binding oxidoreductase [Phytoactinopolyspora alkaliphila]NED93932.1 FAD-binding oxidoreductase [Phytoactinopolyspora alkaliphila]
MSLSTTARAADTLRAGFHGPVHVPGDDRYDAERISWHRTVDPYPAVVAEATTADDIQRAVVTAREHGLPFAVQSTGHGTYVPADGGLLLKTARMNSVEVDPAGRTAVTGPGARWSDVVAAAAPFGLAPLSGTLSVGVTGYTLGGGAGFLSRTHGFAADALVGAELVTSDGRVVQVSAREHPDLHWALRGGSGNFGVVTSLEFRLFPVSQVLAGMAFVDAERAAHVLAYYRDWALDEPVELSTALMVMRMPDAPQVPEPVRGRPVLGVRAFCLAEARRARKHLSALLDVAGPPLLDGMSELAFAEASAALSGPPHPPAAVDQRFELLDDLPDTVFSAMAGTVHAPVAAVELRHWGGAMARPSGEPGPAGHRDAPFSVIATAMAGDVDQLAAGSAALDTFISQVRPHATGGSFLNFLGDPARTRSAYTEQNYRRLAELKRDWDPANVFRTNHNIAPATEGDRR